MVRAWLIQINCRFNRLRYILLNIEIWLFSNVVQFLKIFKFRTVSNNNKKNNEKLLSDLTIIIKKTQTCFR